VTPPDFDGLVKRAYDRKSFIEKIKIKIKRYKILKWFKKNLKPVEYSPQRLKASYSLENFEAAKKILDGTPVRETIIKAMRKEIRTMRRKALEGRVKMKEVLLVTAPWCGSCHAMEGWFHAVEIPGVTMRILGVDEDAEAIKENISSVPTVLFIEDGKLVQTISGALGKRELISKIKSIWSEDLSGYFAEG